MYFLIIKIFKVYTKQHNNYSQLTASAFINSKILVNDIKVLSILCNVSINNSNGSFVFVQKSENISNRKRIR